MSFDTTLILTTLHLETYGYFLFFLKDYELDQNFELSFDSFKLAFQRMPHLLTNGHLGWFLTPLGLFSSRRFSKWIPLII
jgi:hypothetical protein